VFVGTETGTKDCREKNNTHSSSTAVVAMLPRRRIKFAKISEIVCSNAQMIGHSRVGY
jgi:hypothetical protein